MKQIELTQGKFALVDDEDYEELNKYKWYANYSPNTKTFYAVRNYSVGKKKQKAVKMHRHIMQLKGYDISGKVIDHINHDTLDNTKGNLRVCTHSQNLMNAKMPRRNTSGFRGVTLIQSKYWIAQININRKQTYLGSFKSKEDAYEAYISAREKYYGEFAYK